MQTGFVPVFEEKLKKLIKKIEKEYELPKEKRNKDFLKRLAKEAKGLKKLIKDCREEMGTQCCPHCGEKI